MARAPKASFAVALALLASALVAAPAFGSAKDVIRDCTEDGVLNGHYSHGELAKALDQLPSDLDEYTDCRAVIRSAQLALGRTKRKGRRGPRDGRHGVAAERRTSSAGSHEATRRAGSVDVGGTRHHARRERRALQDRRARHRPADARAARS